MRQMVEDGVTSALAFVTAGHSCYSGCRQYREDIENARREIGADAPRVDKIRVFYNHPEFIEANCDHIREAMAALPEGLESQAPILFTAHSIPMTMAGGSDYEAQLRESCRLVAERLKRPNWHLVYQSRSGPPHQPWLEPDICDFLRTLSGEGVEAAVIAPIGFVSDHVEVLYDLDTEAREVCDELGMAMARAKTPGTHPRFAAMIGELIRERIDPGAERRALGSRGPSHDVCPEGCCAYDPAPGRPPAPPKPNGEV
jgi:ferrochelatase